MRKEKWAINIFRDDHGLNGQLFGARESFTLINENLTEATGIKYSSSNPSQLIFMQILTIRG